MPRFPQAAKAAQALVAAAQAPTGETTTPAPPIAEVTDAQGRYGTPRPGIGFLLGDPISDENLHSGAPKWPSPIKGKRRPIDSGVKLPGDDPLEESDPTLAKTEDMRRTWRGMKKLFEHGMTC